MIATRVDRSIKAYRTLCQHELRQRLDEEPLNLGLHHIEIPSAQVLARSERRETNLDGVNLGLELPGLVGSNGGGDDGAGDTASTSEGGLGGNEDVAARPESVFVCRTRMGGATHGTFLSSQRRGKWRRI